MSVPMMPALPIRRTIYAGNYDNRYAHAFFSNPTTFAYGLPLVWAPAAMVVATLSLWMPHKRSRVVRMFC